MPNFVKIEGFEIFLKLGKESVEEEIRNLRIIKRWNLVDFFARRGNIGKKGNADKDID